MQHSAPAWDEVIGTVQITLGVIMCLLVVVQFIKESLQMYKVTRQFRLSRYMNILVSDGMIYFFVYVNVWSLFVSPSRTLNRLC